MLLRLIAAALAGRATGADAVGCAIHSTRPARGLSKDYIPGSCGARLFGAWAFPQGARRIVDAYNGAGGHATLQAVGPNGQEGHNLATSPDGPAVWTPLVEAFLRTLR
jgi:hypothetical protein